MSNGTVTDLDDSREFGLIDSDDGRLLVFSMKNVELPNHDRLGIGSRVEFIAVDTSNALRAVQVRTLETRAG